MWSIRLLGGPRRVNHAGIAWNDKIYCFGGYCSNESYRISQDIDVYSLNTDNYRWSTIVNNVNRYANGVASLPCRRYGHTVTVYQDVAILWGGRNDREACNTLFTFNLRTHLWNNPKTSGQTPAPRDGHTATIVGDYMYIFGGYDDYENSYTTTMYALHIPSLHWTLVHTFGDPPSGRDFHTAVALGHLIYFFGGRIEYILHPDQHSMHDYDSKVFIFDTCTKTWSIPTVPDPVPLGRRSHSTFLYNDYMFILGGFNSVTNEHLNDLWRFCPVTNRWKELNCPGEAPSVRRRHASCVVGDRVFIFGGTSPDGPLIFPDWNLYGGPEHVQPQPQLSDKDDLHVLDFSPSLVTLCLRVVKDFPAEVLEEYLPKCLRNSISAITVPNYISRSLNHCYG